jgi:methionyl-tRNA formyltransferase
MTDRLLAAMIFCGDRSRLGRAVLLAALGQPHPVKAVIVPTAARWARFEARLTRGERAPIQRSAPSRLDPLRRFLAGLRPRKAERDPLDVAWGLPDPSEIPALCRTHRVEMLRVDDANDPSVVARLSSMGAEVFLTGAYPQVFRRPVLEAKVLAVNIHPSLLPRFRGSNPIYWTLAMGAAETGVTAHVMVPQVDAGPILAQRAVPIAAEDEYYSLYGKLVRTVPEVVTMALDAVARGDRGTRQEEDKATAFHEPRPTDRHLNWSRDTARALHSRVRAGGAFAFVGGEAVTVERARLEEAETQDGSRPANGTIVVLAPDGPGVIVTGGRFYLTRVIFRGLPLEGEAFVKAAGLRPGVLLA